MVVITIEDMAEWMKYTQANQLLHTPTKSLSIGMTFVFWLGRIELLVMERSIMKVLIYMMDEEACDGGSLSVDTTSTSSRKKQKRDQLAEVVTSFADSFRDYVETKVNSTPTLSGKEVYTEVSKVYGINLESR